MARVARDLKALREERGWSQKELASAMGVQQPWVSKLESAGGRAGAGVAQNLTLETLERIAVALGCRLVVRFE